MGSIIALHFPKPIRTANGTSFFNFNGISPLPMTLKSSVLEPPNVARLSETARISLTPQEIEEFAPKIRQVIDWFGQLQDVDLKSIEPAIRADTEGDNLRGGAPDLVELENYKERVAKVTK
ncbi:hypothetical protein RND71_012957 [Anisodus tanguticus]|uniref:Glutamyl-tRNA(Gln) amidotransferase subunit C, chloroplastic/mitochondrial n=1 Tax=Anisodus tanguticus TaxID=243964 RepID=A0AAE1SFM3_9SOLA|nr:hypothetical protein RND71_012957 [Anisodus tanguticus]